MKEAFISKRFNQSSINIIDNANYILAEYKAQGYVLTLRQLYYQFVSRDLIKNTMKEYKRIGSVINDARLAGLIDWSMLEDRTRNLLNVEDFDNSIDFLGRVVERYAEPLWSDQPYYCEVWVEKDALVGVIERPCNDLRVPFFACRGYASQSELYSAGKRLGRKLKQGKRVVIFHLGDHDPSGIDMSRDNDDRLNMFAGGIVDVRRLALNEDQIEEYGPPPNPAKMTDSRAEKYVEKFGDESWELDALDPSVIEGIIRLNVEGIIDKPRMEAAAEIERNNRNDLRTLINNYNFVIEAIKAREEE
jgi:hypothetical protein